MVQSDAYPGQHPLPPPDLVERALPIQTLEQPWYRIHGSNRGALFYGTRATNRFDAPCQSFGVLYVGQDALCAIVETFVHSHVGGMPLVSMSRLVTRALSEIYFARPLRMVDLTGPGLVQVGADARLCTGDYKVAQRWSRAFYEHPDKPDGICYLSRHDPSKRCGAVFERADQLPSTETLGAFGEDKLDLVLREAVIRYGFAIID